MGATAISRRGQRKATPRRGDRRELTVLTVTRELLDCAPLAELTMGRIAAAAGLPRSSLYFYFADKIQIFEVLLVEALEEMSIEFERWFADPRNLSEPWLGASVTAAVQAARQNAAVICAATDNRGANPAIERVARAHFERSVARAAQLIDRDRRAGLAPTSPPSAEAIARALMHMTERSIYDLLRSGARKRDAEELIDTLTVLWARGVGSA